MNSQLINFEESRGKVNRRPISRRDLEAEEFTGPLSPIRRRQTPKPPPKVEVNGEDKQDDITVYFTKEENPSVGIKRVALGKSQRLRDKGKMNKENIHDFSHASKLYGEFTFDNQPAILVTLEKGSEDLFDFSKDLLELSEDGKTNSGDRVVTADGVLSEKKPKYSCPANKSNVTSSDKDRQSDSSRRHKASFSRELATRSSCNRDLALGKIDELLQCFQRTEQLESMGSSANPKEVRQAQLKLNKWNWLLKWLDLSSNKKERSRRGVLSKNSPAKRQRKTRMQLKQKQKLKGSRLKKNLCRAKNIRRKFGVKRAPILRVHK